MNLNIGHVRKFLVAVGAAAGVAVTALADGVINTSEGIGIALAFLGAIGVYQIRNTGVAEDV